MFVTRSECETMALVSLWCRFWMLVTGICESGFEILDENGIFLDGRGLCDAEIVSRGTIVPPHIYIL